MKIKKGDKVRIITGKDKYRADNKETYEHEVLACYPKENRILVKDVNVVTVTPSPARRARRAAGLKRKPHRRFKRDGYMPQVRTAYPSGLPC